MGATQGTYSIGGEDDQRSFFEDDGNYRSEVIKLDCPGDQIESCHWEDMPEELEVARGWHTSIVLPESSDRCN